MDNTNGGAPDDTEGHVSHSDGSVQEIVFDAFADTSPEYLRKCFAQRNPGPDASGSTFVVHLTVEALLDCIWEEFAPEERFGTCRYFKAAIPGYLGVVGIDDVAPDRELTFEDPKGTGEAEAVMPLGAGEELPRVAYTTLILGPDADDPKKTVVWTFHPGPPVRPSALRSKDYAGKSMTAAQAKARGVRYVKLAR